MQVITDRAADLAPSQLEGLDITFAPLTLTLDGKSYISGVDIQHQDFYDLLISAEGMPTTSLPSAGEFAELYRQAAENDPDIISLHISSGLSGTFNSARQGAEMVPEANVTVVDTMTLSGAEGWQVEAAARAARAGWSKERTLALVDQVREATDIIYTLPELKWLIHGGRISHLTGLLASALNIKPIIGVNKVTGKYEQLARARTFDRAVKTISSTINKRYDKGTPMRFQVMHARGYEAAETLQGQLAEMFDGHFLPISDIAPVLGAHTGPGLVGVVYAPQGSYPELP